MYVFSLHPLYSSGADDDIKVLAREGNFTSRFVENTPSNESFVTHTFDFHIQTSRYAPQLHSSSHPSLSDSQRGLLLPSRRISFSPLPARTLASCSPTLVSVDLAFGTPHLRYAVPCRIRRQKPCGRCMLLGRISQNRSSGRF